jgi:drug/metabolite transporter (DMT)-like permease
MENNNKKRKVTFKQILLLQAVVMIYTASSIFAKLASGQQFMSLKFILFYGGEICVLGIYALLWQQIIKRVYLSIAYANRAMAIIWSMIWAVVIFKDNITLQNIIGVIIVLIGTMIVNSEHD